MGYSLWDILNMAGYAMWAILVLSVLAVAIAIERLVVQWRFMDRARTLHDTVTRCLSRGALDEARSACERAQTPLADVYLVGYERLGRSKREHLESAVNRERVRVMIDLKRRMWMLGTIGAIGVFVGLFGTVIGIINAFQTIHDSGRSDFFLVAEPIAEALYATGAGILVAVEAVVLYNFFNQRLQRIALELKLLTDEFLEHLEDLDPRAGDGKRAATPDGNGKEDKDGGRQAA
jgi:biopolymer transport protein ExbB/TolQ